MTAPLRVWRADPGILDRLTQPPPGRRIPRRWHWQCRLCTERIGKPQGNSALTQPDALGYALNHYRDYHCATAQRALLANGADVATRLMGMLGIPGQN